MITYTTYEISSHVLTSEGAQIALNGSHEARVWSALPNKGEGAPLTVKELREKVGDEATKVGQGNAFKAGWIAKEGDGFVKKASLCSLSYRAMVKLTPYKDTLNNGYDPIRNARG